MEWFLTNWYWVVPLYVLLAFILSIGIGTFLSLSSRALLGHGRQETRYSKHYR